MRPPIIPERHSSKRGAAESIEEVQASGKKDGENNQGNQNKDYQETVVMMLSMSICRTP